MPIIVAPKMRVDRGKDRDFRGGMLDHSHSRRSFSSDRPEENKRSSGHYGPLNSHHLDLSQANRFFSFGFFAPSNLLVKNSISIRSRVKYQRIQNRSCFLPLEDSFPISEWSKIPALAGIYLSMNYSMGIFFSFFLASSVLGILISRIPFSNLAVASSAFTSRGKWKERMNEP